MHAYQLDKRHDPRILGPVNFTLAVVSESKAPAPWREQSKHSALDLSEGGIRYHDDRDPPTDALLEIRLQPEKDNHTIIRHGRIRWKYPLPDQRGFDIGIEFVGGANEDRNAWHAFVLDRLERIGAPKVSQMDTF